MSFSIQHPLLWLTITCEPSGNPTRRVVRVCLSTKNNGQHWADCFTCKSFFGFVSHFFCSILFRTDLEIDSHLCQTQPRQLYCVALQETVFASLGFGHQQGCHHDRFDIGSRAGRSQSQELSGEYKNAASTVSRREMVLHHTQKMWHTPNLLHLFDALTTTITTRFGTIAVHCWKRMEPALNFASWSWNTFRTY